jgi:chloride channel 3/4/5
VAKWIADAMFAEGIYDLLIELKQYPFLESRKEYVHTMTIMDVTEYLSTIDLDEPMTVGKLHHKLSIISAMGYGEDGGFPILSDGDILEGYIATSEMTHVLEKLEKSLNPTMDENEINNLSCHFDQLVNNTHDAVDPPMLDDVDVEIMVQKKSLNDFSQYIDHVSYIKKHDF